MAWILTAETFKCQRFDCPRLKNSELREVDCPKCGMPVIGKEEATIIRLYQRCKEWEVLPYKGSLLDQPENLMLRFDEITEVIDEHKRKQAEDRESEIKRERLRMGFNA